MSNVFLQGCTAIEALNARLNGSSPETELANNFRSATNNTSFTKKIKGPGGVFPYASGQKVKKDMKEFAEKEGLVLSKRIVKPKANGEGIANIGVDGHPARNFDEDVMGFMVAEKNVIHQEDYDAITDEEKKIYKKGKKENIKLNQEMYEELSEEEQKEYTLKGKEYIKQVDSYEKNITKKRRAKLMVTPLRAIKHTEIKEEFCVSSTPKGTLPYNKEVYSTIMSMGFNLAVSDVGKFLVDPDASGFRDYTPEEVKVFGLRVTNNKVELDKEERLKRIKAVVRGIQHLNSRACQNNNLEDITSKFIILANYKIGNNIFNNVFRNGKLNLEYLREAIVENEEFSLSPIFIGIRAGFMQEYDQDLKDVVASYFADIKTVKVSSVKEAVDSYLEELEDKLD